MKSTYFFIAILGLCLVQIMARPQNLDFDEISNESQGTAYTPIPEEELYDYGELPGISGDSNNYALSKSNVPDTAKEILVYLWATTRGDEAFHRYYYTIQTKDGKQLYTQYMNVAASRDVSLNSANLWLPVFPGYGEVVVTLVDAEDTKRRGIPIAYRASKSSRNAGQITFSEFFILGYR